MVNKILITGSAGFIGSHLADRLLEDYEVVGIDNLSSGHNLNKKVKLYRGSTADEVLMWDLFRGEEPDLVFHLAANTNVPFSVIDPLADFITLRGSMNVVENCRLLKIPLIYISSSFIYGEAKRPTSEREPFRLSAPYGIVKNTFENYLEFYRKVYGLRSVIVRPATVYGPRQVGGAMADYIRKLKAGSQAEIYGFKTRDYLYVSDLIDALILLMDKEGIYNVGTGKETSLESLYSMIAGILDKKADPIFMKERPGEIKRQCLNAKKLRKLGWKPKITLSEGLKLTCSY